MEQNGSKLLKVISILMIIGGIIGAIVSIFSILGAGVLSAASGDAQLQQAAAASGTNMGAVNALVWVSVVFMVISSVVEIVAGVKGVKNWSNPAAAKSLLTLGVVCAVISVIGTIISAIGGSFSVVSLILGLLFPVLYIIGANQLKKQG